MADTLATNNVGLAATFHPFGADAQRGAGTLVGVASVAAIRGLPGHGAYCASKAGVVAYCESLRGECRAAAACGGDPAARLRRHAADGAQPLRHAVPDAGRRPSPRGPSRAIAAGTSYRVIPWQMASWWPS
jgi:NAD(P)-dependent dehydrogenase (short-subunit alcohol dehydrogenase family)